MKLFFKLLIIITTINILIYITPSNATQHDDPDAPGATYANYMTGIIALSQPIDNHMHEGFSFDLSGSFLGRIIREIEANPSENNRELLDIITASMLRRLERMERIAPNRDFISPRNALVAASHYRSANIFKEILRLCTPLALAVLIHYRHFYRAVNGCH